MHQDVKMDKQKYRTSNTGWYTC